MEVLAKGFITITNVNDAYTVLLTPAALSIVADCNNANHDLSNAKSILTVSKGNTLLNFQITSITSSEQNIAYTYRQLDDKSYEIQLRNIPSSIKSGSLQINIETEDEYRTFVILSFNVIANVQDIAWIKEWNGTYNELGKDYIITPKIFAGHKETDGSLTGIYLGKKTDMPAASGYPFQSSAHEGIYGYKEDKIVFFIDGNGAKVGGWNIEPSALCNGPICLNPSKKHIAIANIPSSLTPDSQLYADYVKQYGGVIMQYESVNKYGFYAYNNKGKAVFSSGSTNSIAGWNFDTEALYRLKKSNTLGTFTEAGGITIGSNGIRGNKWRLEADGSGAIAGGKISWDDKGFSLDSSVSIKWGNQEGSLSGILTNISSTGIYTGTLTAEQITGVKCDFYQGTIGGIEITKEQGLQVANYYTEGGVPFGELFWALRPDGSGTLAKHMISWSSDGSGSVAGGNISWDIRGNTVLSPDITISWNNQEGSLSGILTNISSTGIYTGTLTAEQITGVACDFYQGTIGGIEITEEQGIQATKYYEQGGVPYGSIIWALRPDGSGILAKGTISWNSDGSGSIADGNISWDSHGNITLSSEMRVSWTDKIQKIGSMLSYMDANGIYTGELTAEQCKFNKGSIGGIEIHDHYIGAEMTNITGGSLSITPNYIRCGTVDTWAMMGDSSSLVNSSNKISLRINSNNSEERLGGINTGISISVSGASEQNIGINIQSKEDNAYGLKSSVPSIGPTFISNRARIIKIISKEQTITYDFNRYNLFILHSVFPAILTMPSSSAVAKMFRYSAPSLFPEDFAILMTFVIQKGSQKIDLKNIRNSDCSIKDISLTEGDSITLMFCKSENEFVYQVLNYSN